MDRPPSQYLTEDTEFTLPDGVDLVGMDTTCRKIQQQSTPTHQKKQHRKSSSSGVMSALKLVLINLFVCALVLGYALIGSFVFLALEAGSKNSGIHVQASGYPIRAVDHNLTHVILNSLQRDQVLQLKSDTVRTIWDETEKMNILYPDNWTKMASEEVGKFQQELVGRIITLVENASVLEVHYNWTFPRAFLFALTTLTTIGYGGIGPKTSSAKVATMIYAILGIPIMLWYLSNVGSLLAKTVRWICERLCCCLCGCRQFSPNPEDSCSSSTSSGGGRKVSEIYGQNHMKERGGRGPDDDDEGIVNNHNYSRRSNHHSHRPSLTFVLFMCVATLVGYVFGGSWIISRWENWRLLDSFYFCFLTLTTISFGDIRVQRNGGMDRLSTRTEWFCSFFILFGMALTSMFFNILHHEISVRLKRWKTPPYPSYSLRQPDGSPAVLTGGLPGLSDPDVGVYSTDTQKSLKRRPGANSSYSVHFSNYSSPSNCNSVGSVGRNYTEETLLDHSSKQKHSQRVEHFDKGNNYDMEESRMDHMDEYIVTHPIPPPREIYGSHPVFPR